MDQKVKMCAYCGLKIFPRRNIKRSILESLTSGLRPAAAAEQEVQEAQQKFGNKVKHVKTGTDLFIKEIVWGR